MNKAKAEQFQYTEERPAYQPPLITTFTAEELLDIVGPVQAANNPLGDGMDNMGAPTPTGAHDFHKILKVI